MSDKPTVFPVPTHIAAINESLNNVGKQFQKSMDSALGIERSPFSDLAPLAQSLNAESNDLNDTIHAFNKKLRALNFGVEVWCTGSDGLEFGFVRVGDPNEWQLAARCPSEDFSTGKKTIKTMPLLKQSRDERIQGLELLPEILSQLKQGAQQRITAIMKAKKLAASL